METEVSPVISFRLNQLRRAKLKRMAQRLLLSNSEVVGLLIDKAKFSAPKVEVVLPVDAEQEQQSPNDAVIA